MPEATPSQEMPMLTTRQAAEYLNLQPKTLSRWRIRGGGPKFIRVSPRCIRYRASDLDAWTAQRLRRSTSDNGEGARDREWR